GPKFYDKDSGYEYPATVYKGPFIKKIPVVDEPVEATFVIASGSLMRTEVLKDVGLMLDDFFIDFVDVEW
ncbi:TPA: glycosyltransferase family 2 protein, partial [Klebsiella pneumoniae]